MTNDILKRKIKELIEHLVCERADCPFDSRYHVENFVDWIKELLNVPCCHTSGMHDPRHFQNTPKKICQIQKVESFDRLCKVFKTQPKAYPSKKCFWCFEYYSADKEDYSRDPKEKKFEDVENIEVSIVGKIEHCDQCEGYDKDDCPCGCHDEEK